MNSLLYNFSVVILLIGLVLGTYYITKMYYEPFIRINQDGKTENIYTSQIYQERPKTLFARMFNEWEPWINRTGNPTDEEMSREGILRSIHL